MLDAVAPGQTLLVKQVKHERKGIEYPGRVVANDGTHLVVEAIWTETLDAGFVRFEKGDISTEHYFTDRWYSIFEVATPSGELKGWYCNVSRPVVIEGEELRSHDLELDLWIDPERRTLRLDEDEFEASGMRTRDPEAAGAALAAILELEALAQAGLDDVLRY